MQTILVKVREISAAFISMADCETNLVIFVQRVAADLIRRHMNIIQTSAALKIRIRLVKLTTAADLTRVRNSLDVICAAACKTVTPLVYHAHTRYHLRVVQTAV